MTDADTVARELYALRPNEFVAARDAKVAQARELGDRQLAAAIKTMRRPTVSAWVTNLLAIERGDELGRLLSLGVALRDAQASLAAEDLRRLGEQRRQVISALAADGAKCAAEHGQRVGAQVVAEVEQTLQAALSDGAAAEQVSAGRLTTALTYTGFGDAGAAAIAPAKRTRRREGDADRRADGDDRRREQMQREIADADRTLARATAAAEQARERLDDARARRDEQARLTEDLNRRLTDARRSLADADEQVNAARKTLTDAEAAFQQAHSAAESVRAAAADGD